LAKNDSDLIDRIVTVL